MLRLIRRRWALLRLGAWMRVAAFAEDRIDALGLLVRRLRRSVAP